MAETRTYGGYTYEKQADGSWKRMGSAQPQMPADPTFPYQGPKAQVDLANAQANLADTAADNQRADRSEERQAGNTRIDNLTRLAQAYNNDPTVKAYRVAVQQLSQALSTGTGPQADLALTYAFAKAMDPDSVVREAEQGMVTNSQPFAQSVVENIKKQFGMDGAGNYTPEARNALRSQIISAVKSRVQLYDARRDYYSQLAGDSGFEPQQVIGQHDGSPYLDQFRQFDQQTGRLTDEQERRMDAILTGNPRATPDDLARQIQAAGLPVPTNLKEVVEARDQGRGVAPARRATYNQETPAPDNGGYWQSPVSQTMSGVNEGIAGTFGLVGDIPAAMQTGLTNAANYLFGTNLATPADEAAITGQPSLGGTEWWRQAFSNAGLTGPSPQTDTGAFLRRAGQSVGSAVVPLGGAAKTGLQLGGGLLAAAGGGIGAATANQAFPNNPVADFAGEFLGSGLTGVGMLAAGRNRAQNALNAAVPSIDDLKTQAGNLYRQAEQRGVTASPAQTQQFADDFRQTLRDEGQLGPAGRITNADTSTNKSLNLIEQYEGQPMRPTEMDTVRGVIAEGRNSADKADQRLARILLDQFDGFVRPMAPDFDTARDIASRYLQAEDIDQARRLAEARAAQFSGSGMENALRTEFRGLDRNSVKGREWFTPDVTAAIERVSRGTPLSNTARNMGRLAPTNVVSGVLGMGGPATLGYMVGGPAGGLAMGTGAAALGTAGRAAATRMTNNAALEAELVARNGGPIPRAPLMTPDAEALAMAVLAAQAAQGEPVARQNPRRRGMFGR